MSFVNLHVHSAQGSLLDSILNVKDIAKYAKENGQSAIALSDHGFMYGSLNHVLECQRLGIKPITACEIYECDDHYFKNDTKDNVQPRYHLLLIVKNQIGKDNLYKIVSEACTNGMYKKPRVSVQWIKDNNLGEGLICLTACQAGRLSRYLEKEKYQEAEDFINLLKDTFDYVAFEIQSHPTESQLKANTLIWKFANYMQMPYVITTDAHMLSPDQMDTHSIFVEIGEGREAGETYVGCHLQNEEDIFKYLGQWNLDRIIQEGIDESVHIANMVDDNIDYELNKGTIMPKAHIPDGYDVESYFRHLVYADFDKKFGHMSEEEQQIRRDRIESEIPILKELDFLNYLLIQYEFCNECDRRGIPRGYSRGSAANCLCVFMLGITQVDSVKFGLDFTRFANLGRKGSAADIDLDISKSRRQEAVQVLCDIFGSDHVAPMATFNTLSTKVAIRDIGKVLNEKQGSPYFGQIPYSLRDEVTKMIPTVKTLNDLGESEDKDVLLKDLVGKNQKLDNIYKQFPLWFKYTMELEGLPKSRGRHASGTLLTPEPIIHYSPLCLDNEKNPMSMFEMHICQDTDGGMGLVKEDLLGLETLDIIDMALKNAELTWQDVDINHLDLDNKRVFEEVYASGNTVGIFQFESAEARSMSIEAHVDNIEDIIAVNASNRPGTKDSFPDYCKNKLHPEQIHSIHPDLDQIFKATHSILLYQEDSLHLFAYAGFSEMKQDVARRCVDENTLIMMGNGNYKKIKDIQVGEYVMSLDDNGVFVPNKILNVFDNGEQETYQLSADYHKNIIGTANHKMLTVDGWKNIKDISLSDYAIAPMRTNVKTSNMRGNQKPSDSTMFLIGLLIGDGSLGTAKDIHFTNSEDVVIDKFKSCINQLSSSDNKCEFFISRQDGKEVKYVYSVYIKSKIYKDALYKILDKYDLRHKAASKYICDEFMSYERTSKLYNLLAGLFNTDGGYNEQSGAIEYYSISEKLIYQIQSLLLSMGIFSSIQKKKVKGYNYFSYNLSIIHQNSIAKFNEYIVPYMVGRKKDDMIRMYNKSQTKGACSFDYLLPEQFCSEILNNFSAKHMSANDLGYKLGYGHNCFKLPTSKISNKKAISILQYIYAPNTHRLITSDCIPIQIKKISYSGRRHVYDIEVENVHNYVANGMVVHNCIGKKKMEEMKTLKTEFADGVRKKKWTEQQIEDVWGLLEKQASYSFNRGHAVAYSLLSYLTAWLKVYYPVEFMTALLTAKSDKTEKLSAIINDCHRMGIKVLPPKINKSKQSFTGNPEKKEILFGFGAVKGIGDSVIAKIIENQPYESFKDFVDRVQDKTATIALIKANAFPTNNRMALMKKYANILYEPREYKEVSTLPTRAKLLVDFNINVDDYKVGRKVDKETVLKLYNNIRRKEFNEKEEERHKVFMNEFYLKYAQDEELWEFQSLSMFLTNSPIEEGYNITKTYWDDVASGDKAVIFAIIADIKRKKDKNNNQFAYLDLCINDRILEATIWSKQLKDYSELITKGSCIAILGRKEDDHLFVEKVKPYKQWLSDIKSRKKLH